MLNARRRHRRDHALALELRLASIRCSTPEGVIVGITTAGSWPISSFEWCAQRPKASSSGSPDPLQGCFKVKCVLNARRRHRRDHGTTRIAHEDDPFVLNARRRHRRDHDVGVVVLGGPAECSTPEGVIVGITGPSRSRSPNGAGAQRPKASSSGSHTRSDTDPVCLECSTPEGVIVGITLNPGISYGAFETVLNARRRHRRDHGFSGCQLSPLWKVLNARRRHRRDHRDRGRWRPG